LKLDELFSVQGKVAVVTGGSRGIGRMIAAGLVENGVRVYISARKADACDATARELSELGECISIPADLSGVDGAEVLAGEVARREAAVHILVNNAGATWGARLEEFPDDAFDKLWGVNVKAPFHLTRLLLPQLRAAARADDPARVINVGSVNGITVPAIGPVDPPPGVPSLENYAYSSSKAAVHMLSRHLAHRLAREHITVNVIAPGPFESKMMAFALGSEEGQRAVAAGVPLQRVGRPDDVAGTVLFLSSRAGSYLTGAVIPVDGGISTHG
jgi:NAD(P)-dependent dehydrogenase (short-subunit alcohol dehydrogenase family)